jgi:NADH dehydrogenase
MNDRTVTVFGGTGFLGRRVVRHLRKRGFSVRIASRHPDRGHKLFALDDPQLQSVTANIHDERSVADCYTAWSRSRTAASDRNSIGIIAASP